MATSSPFRISDQTKQRMAECAAREGISAAALLDQVIVEGIDQRDHPGIVFRGPAQDRRAALAAGPDVWEVISRLQELDGSEEQRIAALTAESELHPRLIRIAMDYAAKRPEKIRQFIEENRAMAEQSQRAALQRAAVTDEDLIRFAETTVDLRDEEVMAAAWGHSRLEPGFRVELPADVELDSDPHERPT